MTRDELIFAMVEAKLGLDETGAWTVLDGLETAIPGLSGLLDGTHVVVPVDPWEQIRMIQENMKRAQEASHE